MRPSARAVSCSRPSQEASRFPSMNCATPSWTSRGATPRERSAMNAWASSWMRVASISGVRAVVAHVEVGEPLLGHPLFRAETCLDLREQGAGAGVLAPLEGGAHGLRGLFAPVLPDEGI